MIKFLTNKWCNTIVQSYFIGDDEDSNWHIFSSTALFPYDSDYWSITSKNFKLYIDFFPICNWSWKYFILWSFSFRFLIADLPTLSLRFNIK